MKMTEYCAFSFNYWESDRDANVIVEYIFGNETEDHKTEGPHLKDHFSSLATPRLQVTQQRNSLEESQPCQLTIECKPIYCMAISGLSVVSEARTVELYNGKDGAYLQTLRGRQDREDSEADDSRVHFICQCSLDNPVSDLTIKFLSLGQRTSFELAHIRLVLGSGSTVSPPNSGLHGQTIDMDKLRQDIDSMGDTVSDRAKSFFNTLENFQKSKLGAVDDMRHLLLDRNQSGMDGQSMAGITTLLSMFASSPDMSHLGSKSQLPASGQSEGSMVNNMLSQMMSSLAVGARHDGGTGPREDNADMYNFLQSVCGQVSQMRRADETAANAHTSEEVRQEGQATGGSEGGALAAPSAELESRVAAQVEAMVETRLSEVEENIKQQVDQRMEELETRMTGKLDAIFALLQNSQKQS